MKKIKILIVSSTPWDDNNSFGNTFSNLFKNIDCEIANIYLKPGYPNNNFDNIKYFQITYESLLSNLKNKNFKTGKTVNKKENQIITENNNIKFVKKHRNYLFVLLNELIWKIGKWKSIELTDFIDDFNPDLIYAPLYNSVYLNEILLFIKNYGNVPMIGHISDGWYEYNKYIKDPLYYIHHYFCRKKAYKIITQCEFVDTFSYIQKNEYEKIFNVPFKIRYKSADIKNIENKTEFNNPLIFLYTGNLGNKRWINLVEIGKILDIINKKEVKSVLNIYSSTPLTEKMKKEFASCKSLNFMGSVSGEEVQKIQANADILIHTESFDKKEIQTVRMSLSTKIIDYLAKGKCIIAYGSKEVASIDYFIQNDCTLVIDNPNDLFEKINKIVKNKDLIAEYGQKALNCAVKNHNKNLLHKQFYEDLCNVIEKK